MANSRKDRIAKFARKNRINRILIIILLAVVIFIDHLTDALSAKKRITTVYVTVVAFLASMLAPIILPAVVYAGEIVVDEVSLDVSEVRTEDETVEQSVPVIPIDISPSVGIADKEDDDTDNGTVMEAAFEDLSDDIQNDNIDESVYENSDSLYIEEQEDIYEEQDAPSFSDEIIFENDESDEEEDDNRTPIVDIQPIGFISYGDLLVGGKNCGLSIENPNMNGYDEALYSPAIGVNTNVGDGYYSLVDGWAYIELENDYDGVVEITPIDEYGNEGELITYKVIVDKVAPSISLNQVTLEDGTINVGISVSEDGNSYSGISEVDVWIDGELCEDIEPVNSKSSTLSNGLLTIESQCFEYHATKDGTTVVTVVAYDSVGNCTDITEIIKVKRQYSAMSMRAPSRVNLMLDPWNVNGNGTLYSSEFQIQNNSEYDVRVDLNSLLFTVNRQAEEYFDGLKTVELSIVVLSTGERISLSEGSSHDVFSVVLPCKDNGDNELSLQFVGKIAEGSENLWNKGDISLDLVFRYTPAESDAEENKKNKKI